ncbi:hypothetical protein D8B26_006076 [Coccidioides posadasii str. Silveira]|uniref:Uncharacterized protein n=1 Tax=Coccidioides posadasii (strain RMSCC 757 / Silveira) TaxID=443226 RepID=E9DBS4_COCPS|nr:conserved hypothetical protein [Coccidioides posadasii str. Silveira]QVM11428.1 hypothetical protein D8B26_006076 [Coccidioides posadasii str. Silveira]
MATALFPVGKHSRLTTVTNHKACYVPSLLADMVCAASDARDALDLFLSLYNDDDGNVSTTGYMAFDAHVGDTSCQLRASMIMMLLQHLRKEPTNSLFRTMVSLLIGQLEDLIKMAKNTCRRLTKVGESPESLGLSKSGESRQSLLEKLGWQEPVMLGQDGFSSYIAELSQVSRKPTPLVGHESPQISWQFRRHNVTIGVTISMPGQKCPPYRSKSRPIAEKMTPGSPENWDPSNFSQVVRLIVYSYMLSKYKRFCRRTHVVGAELNPKLPLSVRDRLVSQDHDTTNRRFLLLTGPKRFEQDFASMQNWVGELSCSWLKLLASRFGDDKLPRLLEQTTRISPKGLTSIPNYIGFLALRQFWAQTIVPILIMEKRFCGLGNSLNGTYDDYMRIKSPAHVHDDDQCPDNFEHCQIIKAVNMDRIALAIFAEHKHYSFELTGEDGRIGEAEVVGKFVEEADPWLRGDWEKRKYEAFDLGTGFSLKTIMWQHVVLETVGRAAALMEANLETIPLGAPVSI